MSNGACTPVKTAMEFISPNRAVLPTAYFVQTKESDELSPRDRHNWGRRGFQLYYLQTSHISEDLDPA